MKTILKKKLIFHKQWKKNIKKFQIKENNVMGKKLNKNLEILNFKERK